MKILPVNRFSLYSPKHNTNIHNTIYWKFLDFSQVCLACLVYKEIDKEIIDRSTIKFCVLAKGDKYYDTTSQSFLYETKITRV